ncbi:hypothetical protein FAUST_11831 [Fusarium austroamericanum]|uniref:Apple domain-containing protein n=1 Tax=Fusarium austroamericanum TaxID=282268 RepID=A0AAN5YYV6_FUSAU|nr:hypothetical protein FAUST_11831 [Fusarium austroamericanum]
MLQINIIAGYLSIFALGVTAGPCHPSVTTTTLAISEIATATTDLTTMAKTQTTASIATTISAPKVKPACNIQSPQTGANGGTFQVYCDRYMTGTRAVADYKVITFSECLDYCDQLPGCQGVHYLKTMTNICTPWALIGTVGGTFGDEGDMIVAIRFVPTDS